MPIPIGAWSILTTIRCGPVISWSSTSPTRAFEHIRQSLCSLLDDHDISYLKWDMNRDLVAPTDSTGRAAGRARPAPSTG